MAHQTKHRRSLAAQEPVALTEPSFKKQLKPTAATALYSSQAPVKTSEHTLPSKAHNLPNTVYSRLYTIARHKPRTSNIDPHFQAKPLSASADFESSKHKTGGGIEKQRKKTEEACELVKPKKASVKEKRGNKVVEHGIVDFKKFNSLLLEKELRRSHDELEARRSSGSLAAAVGGRRRSFCGLQVELGDVFASNGVKVVSADMPPFMQIHAVDCARKTRDSLEKFTCKTLALTLKKEFDGVYGPAWHCIVGSSFGSFVTHSVGGFMYFSMDQKMYILLFKTTVQRAD